jgi:putative hydrolase
MTQEPFGDIPLFREIQRLLASGGGPVNKEIARQVAGAIVASAGADPSPLPQEKQKLAEVVHQAETLFSGYTRLSADEPLRPEPVTREWWVRTTLDAWSWMFEHLAKRFSGELGRLDAEGGEAAGGMQAAMAQIAPLLMGIQVGTLVGHLGKEIVGRYDVPIPRDDDGRLFVVVSNISSLANDYGIEGGQLTRWVAMHESARGIISKRVVWVDRFFRGLLTELINSIEIDVGALEQRLIELQSGGIEAVQEGLGEGGLGDGGLPVVASQRHQTALHRLQAMVAIFEGYANNACKQIAREIIDDAHRVDEIMARRAISPSEGATLLAGLPARPFAPPWLRSKDLIYSIEFGKHPTICRRFRRSRTPSCGWSASNSGIIGALFLRPKAKPLDDVERKERLFADLVDEPVHL